MKPHALRLDPGKDLKAELTKFCLDNSLQAGFVLSGIGSLRKLKLRLANSTSYLEKTEFFEILSLQGTLSPAGVHLHISVADSKGHCWGGHLMEGCEIYTTAEILIQELPELRFSREDDPKTGFKELKIHTK